MVWTDRATIVLVADDEHRDSNRAPLGIDRRSDPCDGMSPHGYLGIEGMVVQRISDWIRAAGGH
jgi:hypothetical protein